jgi:hypothetical protein
MRDLLCLGPSTPLLSSRRPSETSRLQLLRFVNTSNARVCTNNADMYQLCARIARSGICPSLALKSSTYAPNARILATWNTSALSTRTYTQRCNPPKELPIVQHRSQRDTSLRTKWDSWRTVSRVSKVLSKSLELLIQRAQTPSLASSWMLRIRHLPWLPKDGSLSKSSTSWEDPIFHGRHHAQLLQTLRCPQLANVILPHLRSSLNRLCSLLAVSALSFSHRLKLRRPNQRDVSEPTPPPGEGSSRDRLVQVCWSTRMFRGLTL